MSRGYPLAYDDEWIVAHWWEYRNWAALHHDYNAVHCTDIGYNTFKSHCNRELGLSFKYSQEEIAFLRKHYPVLGYIKTTELFNSTFGNKRSAHGIQVKCKKMGLKPTSERKAKIPIVLRFLRAKNIIPLILIR